MFPIIVPEIDPVALAIGPIAIRWYSLAYIFGIIFTMLWLKKSNQKEKFMSQEAYDDWLMWIVFSILLGGRLGYVLFYGSNYFLNHPLEIFAIWNGGMSFHGGLFGVIFGMWLFCKKYNIYFFKLMDVLAVAAPVGLFCGRIANFINLELYGRITGSNFGFIFPNAGELPRHPSQLYEAFFEGIILFAILFYFYNYTKLKNKIGVISGLFLSLYGLFRILLENFREPDQHLGFLFAKLTMGQVLSLPLIFSGLIIIYYSSKKEQAVKK